MLTGQRRYEPLVGLEGVAPGGTATAKMTLGRRHLIGKIFATAKNADGTVTITDPTQIIESVVHTVNSKTIREETAADLMAIQKLNSLPASVGCLPTYYAEPKRAAVDDELLTGWDMNGDVYDATVKLKLKTGITNPEIRFLTSYDLNDMKADVGGKMMRVRQILKREVFTHNIGSRGDITTLPIDLPIQRIYLKAESGKTIDSVKVVVDDTVTVFEMTRAENAEFLKDYGLDATAFSFPLCFDIEGQLLKRLEGIKSLRITVQGSAAQTITSLVERVAPTYL